MATLALYENRDGWYIAWCDDGVEADSLKDKHVLDIDLSKLSIHEFNPELRDRLETSYAVSAVKREGMLISKEGELSFDEEEWAKSALRVAKKGAMEGRKAFKAAKKAAAGDVEEFWMPYARAAGWAPK